MRNTTILTPSNNLQTLITNNDLSKAISIRGMFMKGNNLGGSTRTVIAKYLGSPSGINLFSGTASDLQLPVTGTDFNYALINGQDVIIEVVGLNPGESIYIEADYELI